MDLQVYRYRSGLARTLKAIEKGSVTIGFIGGSITDSRGGNNWPEYIASWFVNQFPGVRVNIENAAIGATGSALAVFRAERDLIGRNCDLVFVEFAVNDSEIPCEQRKRTREGLIRKLLNREERDLVLVYTFYQKMYSDIMNGIVPDSIKEFEEIAGHYGIGSVWAGLHAINEVKKGWMRWEEWLPDGVHPGHRGSLCYAQSVINYLEKELVLEPKPVGIPSCKKLPEPLNKQNWENTYMIPFEDISLTGPWTVRRWANLEWIDRVLYTAAVGAKLSFSFEGRGMSLGFDFGLHSAEFRCRLDGGDWMYPGFNRPEWCPDRGWFYIVNVADELEPGIHHVELEVIHGNSEKCKGTNFFLAFAGVIR